MLENVNPVGPIKGPSGTGPAAGAPKAEGERSFKDILQDSIDSVNRLQQEADGVVERYLRGDAREEEVAIASKKAQLAFEALLQIRNKLVSAFEQIQQMRV